ncbi:MAG: recombinase RecT [Actinobacteria bacterium]|nr:recombinase RecT [Actinomycetota bacterium]
MSTDTTELRGKLAQRSEAQAVEHAEAKQPKTIGQLIDLQRTEIARALPKHMDADRLARIATTTIKTTPKLMECSATSLLGALMLSAQTGLEPGPLGHVYFVPRWNGKTRTQECQWQLGYRGIIELARNSGKLVSIEAREVRARDHFEFRYGLDEKLEHQPFMAGDRGEIIAAWGLAKFTDGGHYFVVLSRSDIDEAMARSDSAAKGFGPWITDYAAMARKTVIRRMAPFLPLSAEQAQVIAQDESVHNISAGDRIAADIAAEPRPEWIDSDIVDEDPEPEPAELVDPSPADEPLPEPPPVDADTGEIIDVAADDSGFVAMTQPQNRKLHALLREVGIASGDRHEWASNHLGREITSLTEVSKTEAARLIDTLEAAA